MNLKNKMYVNSTVVNEILYRDAGEISLDMKSREYFTLNPNNNTEYVGIINPELLFGLFHIVPGFRIIQTIEETMEFSLNYNHETLYFEKEESIRYALNVSRILSVENIDSLYWRIVMVDGTCYWFKAFSENFKQFLTKLAA